MIIPTLMYHSVEKESSDYLTISCSTFQQHIEYLSNYYNIIRVEDIIDSINKKKQIPSNSIVITFDDSYKNNFTYALPILQQYAVKAVFFVIAGYINNFNLWNRKAFKLIEHMSINDIKILYELGYEIGNHTLTHQRLTKLTDDLLYHELDESNNILYSILGIQPYIFAYPYGGADDRCARICNEIFSVCFSTTRIGNYDWENNQIYIRRIYVSPNDNVKELNNKIINYYRGIYNE